MDISHSSDDSVSAHLQSGWERDDSTMSRKSEKSDRDSEDLRAAFQVVEVCDGFAQSIRGLLCERGVELPVLRPGGVCEGGVEKRRIWFDELVDALKVEFAVNDDLHRGFDQGRGGRTGHGGDTDSARSPSPRTRNEPYGAEESERSCTEQNGGKKNGFYRGGVFERIHLEAGRKNKDLRGSDESDQMGGDDSDSIFLHESQKDRHAESDQKRELSGRINWNLDRKDGNDPYRGYGPSTRHTNCRESDQDRARGVRRKQNRHDYYYDDDDNDYSPYSGDTGKDAGKGRGNMRSISVPPLVDHIRKLFCLFPCM